MANVISICNQKGGVGKTTTAINLATYLSLANKKTLLIDLDPQGNATSGLGINKHDLKKSVYDVITNETSPKEVIIKSSLDQLSIMPSSIGLTGAEVELVGTLGREYRLRKAISSILVDFDYIIIDCPPSLGLLTINALAASGSIIIPVQCEYYALEGVGQLVNTINLIKESVNPSLSIEGVLLTMADYRTKLTAEVIDEIRRYFDKKVFSVVIPRNIKISEAPGFGKPMELYDPDSIGALKYRELANEILGDKTVTYSTVTPITN